MNTKKVMNTNEMQDSLKNNLRPLVLLTISLIVILSLFVMPVSAQNNHIHLLAVSEGANGTMHGGVADLFLEIRKGSGQVFIDTYPISRFDTQLSIRFAKDVACRLANVDCSQYDFLYTIRAQSQMVGGPSAGAAVALITYAQLQDLSLKDNIALTGTMNSGRLVGSVGSIQQKINGAAANGISTVLIPVSDLTSPLPEDDPRAFTVIPSNISPHANATNIDRDSTSPELDLVAYGRERGVTVIGVSDLEEVIFHGTGYMVQRPSSQMVVHPEYTEIMQTVADELCSRSDELVILVNNSEFIHTNERRGEPLNVTFTNTIDILTRAHTMYDAGAYYSAASQCFSANMQLSFLHLLSKENDLDYYELRLSELRQAAKLLEGNIRAKNITTITDLQTAMIVRQRISEAEQYIDAGFDFLDELREIQDSTDNSSIMVNANDTTTNTTNDVIVINTNALNQESRMMDSLVQNTAMAIERLFTTSQWTKFFNITSEGIQLDNAILENSCQSIITSTQERIQYAHIYLPNRFDEQNDRLIELRRADDPAFCIAEATQIRANVNAVVSVIGLREDGLKELIQRKLVKAREVISEETNANRFPIMGYSYYEYARALLDADDVSYSALLYAEYALELSAFEIYMASAGEPARLHQRSMNRIIIGQVVLALCILIIGIIIGVHIALFGIKKRNARLQHNSSNKNKASLFHTDEPAKRVYSKKPKTSSKKKLKQVSLKKSKRR
ncbi:MAG: S16 family serine protease [Candidatus Woesearchaeota archaeon]